MRERIIRLKISEILLLLSGAGILASVVIIGAGGGFAVWTIAKVCYGLGVLLFVFDV